MIRLGFRAMAVMITGILAIGLYGYSAQADDGERGNFDKSKWGKGYQITFNELDTDNDGMITAEDIQVYHEERFKNIDLNGDGLISEEEWLSNLDDQISERRKSRISRMFDKIDNNDDGMISSDEMPAKRMDFDRMLKKLDRDGDGAISEDEFNEGRSMGKKGNWKSEKRGNKKDKGE
ncbi:MAG: hypothetical protein F4073_05235 [Rhodobacteraceae bacterium]|nr:hypothetical protein [Paracoccaceae bacterium]MYF45158.1 hypothetical protein [Paracoccaceae bacterium]MYI91341.1 hypothetical protein [Paracoccaceae bacterium]